ncbi:anthranilate phosphoribosyltransferase [Microlunatus soli]|uniref:Anthranilate phosphoribosyltransferase n=1 Tax=Microlunatus soli TaxID=630515 RepID=A0A1H1PPH3_9ACTN|nr:anthranilate phosphoribosyltransferase [Microlunatus soli]SDS12649.1 anthranilate phosphoribosyltransferase [Microlunatus soli]
MTPQSPQPVPPTPAAPAPADPAADPPAPRNWPGVLTTLIRGQALDRDDTAWAMGQILAGEASDVQIAGFAVALRSKGETVEEISGLADAMLAFATPIQAPSPAVDIVGSGGDRSNTVNISTMAAIVAAAAGARVVKHGSRSASSACGAADVLEALGVRLDLSPGLQRRVIDELGIGFLFAPHYHPSLRNAASARSQLGVLTPFNFLGPLTNPGRPVAHAVGVAVEEMAALTAGVLADRGDRGVVFHGTDGLDELTTTTTSAVWLFDHGSVEQTELDPRDLGIERSVLPDLVGGDPALNAQIAREVLSGSTGPVRDIVLLNAAAALAAFDGPGAAADLVDTLRGQLARAADAVDSGAASRLLTAWAELTSTIS